MFASELEENLPHLRAFARLLCKNPVLADDIVQDTCLKAWAARDTYDSNKGAFRPWLFRIMRNEFYQRGRRSWRVVNFENDHFESLLVTKCGLEARNDLSRMLAAIASLKAAQRDAFLLVVAAGFTYEEAGAVCECAPGTVKSRVSRAREHVLARYYSTNPIVAKESPAMTGNSDPIEQLELYISEVVDERHAA